MLKSDNFDELMDESRRQEQYDKEYQDEISDKVFDAPKNTEMSVAEAYRKG
jgi:hypothetical protein